MIKRFMKRKPGDPGDSASLNDLSFILIIFFIAIAGFNVNKGFLLNLPDSSRPRVVRTDDLMKCAIDGSGAVTLDGKPVRVGDLETAILAKRSENPNMTFFLTISPDAVWQDVVDVIHEVRRLDIENFSFKMGGGPR